MEASASNTGRNAAVPTYNPFNTAPPVRLLVKRTLRGSFWLFQMCPGQGTSVLSGVSRKGARRRSVGGFTEA